MRGERYQPPWVSFSLASSSSLPGSSMIVRSDHKGILGNYRRTSVERWYLPGVWFPEVLSLV